MKSYTLLLVLCATIACARAQQPGWLKVVDQAIYAGSGSGYTENFPAMDQYDKVTNRIRQSTTDDFYVPDGHQAQKVLIQLAAYMTLSENGYNPPDYVRIGIVPENTTTHLPISPLKAVYWGDAVPIGKWTNVTGFLNETTYTTRSPDWRDWFECDVSSANNGTGLGSGRYWLIFTAIVRANRFVNNNYATETAYYIYPQRPRCIDCPPETYGLQARLPKRTNAAMNAILNDWTAPVSDDVWTLDGCTNLAGTMPTGTDQTLTDPGTFPCGLDMNVYIWSDSVDAADPLKVPDTMILPPPLCERRRLYENPSSPTVPTGHTYICGSESGKFIDGQDVVRANVWPLSTTTPTPTSSTAATSTSSTSVVTAAATTSSSAQVSPVPPAPVSATESINTISLVVVFLTSSFVFY